MTFDVAAARQVGDAATPAPWGAESDESADVVTVGAGTFLSDPGSYVGTDLIYECDVYSDDGEEIEQRVADAALIVFARNNWGPMLDRIDELKRLLTECDALMEFSDNINDEFKAEVRVALRGDSDDV